MTTTTNTMTANPTPNPAFKLLIVGRRRAGQTLAEHHHHLLENHGKMVLKLIASNPEHAPRRYAQNRVLDGTWRNGGPVGGSIGDPFALNRDFVTQVWFDNPVQAMDALSHPLYKTNLQPDEDRFVDQASVVKLAVRERLIGEPRSASAGLGSVKLFAFFSKSATTTSADFNSAWQRRAEQLARSQASGRFHQYVQNQVVAKPGELPPVDGVDEFWVADAASATQLMQTVQSTLTAPLLADGLLAPGAEFFLVAQEFLLFAGAGSKELAPT